MGDFNEPGGAAACMLQLAYGGESLEHLANQTRVDGKELSVSNTTSPLLKDYPLLTDQSFTTRYPGVAALTDLFHRRLVEHGLFSRYLQELIGYETIPDFLTALHHGDLQAHDVYSRFTESYQFN